MQSRFLLQVLFILSALIFLKAQDVIASGPSCLRSSPAGDGLTRIKFLREDAAGVRSLYLTLWSEDMRPVTCEVNTDQLVTERYRALCNRSGTHDQEITQRFNISVFLAPDAPCALVSSSAPKFTRRTRTDGTEGKVRRKRAWVFPGTLWCGTGSKAGGYEQLGMFESADRCCREHDHCLHIIPAFTANYGLFNSKFYTVSHCDCDQRFRQCLLGVNDTISNMVGYSFFNILQVPCFVLKQQRRCTTMNWWGRCKLAKEAPCAILKSSSPYNTTDVGSGYGDNSDGGNLTSSEEQQVTESPVIIPHTKSPKSKHRCSSKDHPRGDTFYRRGKKGKGCKRHQKLHTVAPSQIPSISRAHNTTTPSMNASVLHASKSSTLMPNKRRAGKKKSTRKGQSAYTTRSSQVSPPGATNSYPQKTFATQKPAPELHLPTAMTAVTTTAKIAPNRSRCCGFGTPLREDTSQPHCKGCLGQNMASHVTPRSTTTLGLPIKVTTLEKLSLKKTTETPKQDTWSTANSATPATAKPNTVASIHTVGKPQKQMDSQLLWNITHQGPMGSPKAPNMHAERGWKQNIALHNMTDNQLLCGSLNHLDRCKYKIPPLEKKYDLQNMESKTAYHCDCTSRLAGEIESFEKPSILPSLLTDFVSQYCFELPKKKDCRSRKSCSGGFTKASDLLRALKKIEENDTAGVRKSGNGRKRGIPVRLCKRCLRLEREADIMAQLT